MASPRPYRSNHALTRWVVLLLLALALVSVLHLASTFGQIRLLGRMAAGLPVSMAAAEASDNLQTALAALRLLVLIPTAITFLVWIYRMYANLPALCIHGLKRTPGWAVGGWFVPVINLWHPFAVVREIWKGSDPACDPARPLDWQAAPSTPLIGFGWWSWLASGLAGQWAQRAAQFAIEVEDLIHASWLFAAGLAMSALAISMLVALVREIHVRQEEKSGRVLQYWHDTYAPPQG